MAIEMTGGVYCPLSPRDPQHRLHALIEQTRSRLVLIHSSTTTKFSDDVVTVDIDSVLINNSRESEIDVDSLSGILVTPEDIAYVIFTSGSTGAPKAVSIAKMCHAFVTLFLSFLLLGSSSTSQLHSIDAFVCAHRLLQRMWHRAADGTLFVRHPSARYHGNTHHRWHSDHASSTRKHRLRLSRHGVERETNQLCAHRAKSTVQLLQLSQR